MDTHTHIGIMPLKMIPTNQACQTASKAAAVERGKEYILSHGP